MIERQIRPRVLEALNDTRVVMVMGARQVGKSTLCESIAEAEHPAEIVSMDDKGTRETAQSDPTGFLAGFDGPVFIDEDRSGRVVAIEVKASASFSQRDTAVLAKLRDSLGEQFAAGAIIHTGEQTIPAGDRLWALPLSGLWA